MPNIREQRVDEDGIYIKASDGREVTLTRADIRRLTARARSKVEGQAAVAKAIEDALGPEQVPMRMRRVPLKVNPAFDARVTDPEGVRSRREIPDPDNAYDEDTILVDYDERNGSPLGLEVRS